MTADYAVPRCGEQAPDRIEGAQYIAPCHREPGHLGPHHSWAVGWMTPAEWWPDSFKAMPPGHHLLYDVACAVLRMEQASTMVDSDALRDLLIDRLATCDAPRLRRYLPPGILKIMDEAVAE